VVADVFFFDLVGEAGLFATCCGDEGFQQFDAVGAVGFAAVFFEGGEVVLHGLDVEVEFLGGCWWGEAVSVRLCFGHVLIILRLLEHVFDSEKWG